MCLFVFLGDSGDRLGATRRKIHPATFVVAKGPTCFVSGQGDVLFMTRVRELLGSDPLFWFMNVSPVTSLRLSLGPFAVICSYSLTSPFQRCQKFSTSNFYTATVVNDLSRNTNIMKA